MLPASIGDIIVMAILAVVFGGGLWLQAHQHSR